MDLIKKLLTEYKIQGKEKGRILASVELALDFTRYACHNTGHHHLAAGPNPAHNLSLHQTPRVWRSSVPVIFAL